MVSKTGKIGLTLFMDSSKVLSIYFGEEANVFKVDNGKVFFSRHTYIYVDWNNATYVRLAK